MDLQFKRNVAFTKLVKINNRLREFNFRQLPNAPHELFHVDTSDDRGNRIIFRMQKEDNSGHWHILEQPLPKWISDSETSLDEAIEQEIR